MITPIIITYLALSVLVTLFATGRRISFAGAFVTSVFLSPLVGLVAIIKSDKNIRVKFYATRYVCPNCNYEYTEEKTHCSFCGEMGNEEKLKPNKLLLLE
jgi:hypothetical protein